MKITLTLALKTLFAFLIFSTILFSSCCKKDEHCLDNDICSEIERYVPLAVGNYWIYDNVAVFTGSTSNPIASQDTVRVIGTKIIDHKYYYMLESTASSLFFQDTFYWRLEQGLLLDELDNVYFAVDRYDEVLHTAEFYPPGNFLEYRVKDSLIYFYGNVGNTEYDCLDFKGCYFLNNEPYGEHAFHNYFARDVGLVFKNSHHASPVSGLSGFEFRLVLREYYLN